MYNAIQQASQVKQGLNYLVPTAWWEQFQAANFQVFDQSQFYYPPLSNQRLIDTFLLDFKDDIQDQYELKCNYLKFQRVFISSQIHPGNNWKPVPPFLWKLFLKSKPNNNFHPVITYLNSPQQDILKSHTTQISIVFCSRATSHLFVGFIPQNAPLVNVVREVGFQMGFIEMQNSKINFPDKYTEKSYSFAQLENVTIKKSPDSLLMVFNLQRQVDEQEMFKKLNTQEKIFKNGNNESNEAVAGDLLTMVDESNQRAHDGTLSTGAETPFSFFGSEGYDLDCEYRVNELFRDKSPEEVYAMKLMAKEAINGELIEVPDRTVEAMQQELDKMAEEILESLHTHKKKNKERQIGNIYE